MNIGPIRHVAVPGRKNIYTSQMKYGKVYEVRYRDSNGRWRFQLAGPLLKDALDLQASVRVKLVRGERVAPDKITFGEVAGQWEHSRLNGTRVSEPTAKRYREILCNRLVPEFGSAKVQSITPDMIADWLAELRTLDGKRPLGGSAKQTVYVVLGQVLGYASNPRRGYIPLNPCDALEHGERPRAKKLDVRLITPDEASSLLDASAEWLKPIVQTAMLTGMRANEVLGLRWQDVSFLDHTIHVQGQMSLNLEYQPTKGRSVRSVPFLPALRVILRGLPSRFQNGYVFLNGDGKPRHYSTVNHAWAEARKASGVSDKPRPIRLHDCRHTFASALLRDGKDVTWVAEILGHKDATTTLKTYAHVIHRENRNEEATVRLAEAYGEWARG